MMQNLKILTLNCQKGVQPTFKSFFQEILVKYSYDFILLQEANIKVCNIFDETDSSYKILNPYDINLGESAHLCIIYKSHYDLRENFLISFARLNCKVTPHGWGLLIGFFKFKNINIILGSVHLHSGLNTSIRFKELEIIKNNILPYLNKNNKVILGGDFNSGLKSEIFKNEKKLLPEFILASKNIGYTFNSLNTEEAPYLLNNISVLLAKHGISFSFCTDHFFVDTLTMKTSKQVSCTKVLSDVSDHLPVELVCIYEFSCS